MADEKNKKWIECFKNQGIIAIPTDSNLEKRNKGNFKGSSKFNARRNGKSSKQGRINKNIRIMICGIPNVGKSSFINRMINKKSAEVGNRPGVTKQKTMA